MTTPIILSDEDITVLAQKAGVPEVILKNSIEETNKSRGYNPQGGQVQMRKRFVIDVIWQAGEACCQDQDAIADCCGDQCCQVIDLDAAVEEGDYHIGVYAHDAEWEFTNANDAEEIVVFSYAPSVPA